MRNRCNTGCTAQAQLQSALCGDVELLTRRSAVGRMRYVTGAIYEERKRVKLVAHIKIIGVKEEKNESKKRTND